MTVPGYINPHSHELPSGIFEVHYYSWEPSWKHALARVAARLLDQAVGDMGVLTSLKRTQQDS